MKTRFETPLFVAATIAAYCGAAYLGCAAYAEAQEHPMDIIAKVEFDPKTYAVYKDWAKQTLGEAEQFLKKRGYPMPKPDSNLGILFQSVSPGQAEYYARWYQMVLTFPPAQDVNAVVLMAPRGTFDPGTATMAVLGLIQGFQRCVPGDVAAYKTKRAENDTKIADLERTIQALEKELQDKTQAHLDKLHGMKREDVDAREFDIDKAALDVQLKLAEAEARRKVIMQKAQEAGGSRVAPQAQPEKGANDRIQALKRRVELAEEELNRTRRGQQDGITGKAQVDESEVKLQALKQALSSAEQFDKETTLASATQAQSRLKELLTETEIDIAGLQARLDAVNKRKAELDALRDEFLAMKRETAQTTARRTEFKNEAQKLRDFPKGPQDFPLPEPVIEWVNVPAPRG